MLTLHIEAETLAELRQKVLDTLGQGAPVPAMPNTTLLPSAEYLESLRDPHRHDNALPQDEAPKRVRRTKAQIEADNAAAQATSQSGDQSSAVDQSSTDAGASSGLTAQQIAPLSEDELKAHYNAHIKPAVLKVSAKLGRPGVEQLLAHYNVTNAQDIAKADWPGLLQRVDAMLTEG